MHKINNFLNKICFKYKEKKTTKIILTINIIKKSLIKLYVICSLYFLIFDYKYFGITALFFLFLYTYLKTDIKFTYFEQLFLKISPYIFYFKKLLIGLFFEDYWSRTFFDTTSQFPDLKGTLMQLTCQSKQQYLLSDNFSLMTENCFWDTWRYGPLFHMIKFPSNDYIFIAFAILFYISFFFFISKFSKETYLNEFELNLLLLSPVINQILNQLNIDLFIFLIFYFLIKYQPQRQIFNLTIFFTLALIKSHPMGLLFGFLFYRHQKKYVSFLSSLYSVLFVITYIYFIYIDISFLTGQPRPSGLDSSNGLLTISQYIWINLFNRMLGFRFVIIVVTSILLILTLFLYFKKNIISSKIALIKTDHDVYYFSTILWFLVSSLYANYDYRNIILVLAFTFVKENKIVTIFFLGLFMVSPIPVLNLEMISNIFYIFKIVCYLFVITSFAHLFLNNENNVFKKLLKNINYL